MKSTSYPLARTHIPSSILKSRADHYRRFSSSPEDRFTEQHLKCIWYDAVFRPSALFTHTGAPVVVEDPGRWNLEEGPDFIGAALRIGNPPVSVVGDIEIHVHPADWNRHGHAANPRYGHLAAHITYYPGPLPDTCPRGVVQIALKDALDANPFFSFENIDLTAYPFAAVAGLTPCSRILSATDPDRVQSLLDAAGTERLRRKSQHMAEAIARKGRDQTFYEEIMCSLGYKKNRGVFRYLAEHLPLTALRDTAQNDPLTAYAVFMGISGLLPPQTSSRWNTETRAFIRQVWNLWWKHQSIWTAPILDKRAWALSGLRPHNHPQRRLMAAAAYFASPVTLLDQLRSIQAGNASHWIQNAVACLEIKASPVVFWQRRLGFSGEPQQQPVALVGSHRAAAMMSNVVIPFMNALSATHDLYLELLTALPAEDDNSIVRQSANLLLGRDHQPALYRNGLRQQGLIQIFNDFCMHEHLPCNSCGLVKLLQDSAEKTDSRMVGVAPDPPKSA